MGVMDKMRQSTGVILWVLIISFGFLWVLADTQFFDAIMQGPRALGSVNGEEISIEEYNNRISYYIEQYSQETGNSVDPETRANFEERAWDEVVTGKLLQQKMNDLGINVTDQEVVDMIMGDNPDPFIRQQFQGEDGTIDRVALRTAIESPENRELWIAIEDQMRQKRRQQKMNSYLESSMEVSQYEIEQEYIRRNTTAEVAFVRFPYSDVTESEVSVTEDDLREYYNNNSDQFEREETYQFSYVSFDKTPTAQDTARTFQEMEELREDFSEAESDSLFLNNYQSTTEYSVRTVDEEDIRDLYAPVTDLEVGEVTEVIAEQGRLYLLKKVGESGSEVSFVVFSMDIIADPVNTVDERAKEADDFSFFAEEDGFEGEAERRGLEEQETSATKGSGFIPGIGESQQVMSFLESASEGEVSGALELSNQFVVIKVDEIISAGVRPFEEVEEQIRSIVTTEKRKQQLRERAEELLEQNNDLASLAESAGKEVSSVESIAMNASNIPGAGREPKVVGAIFGLEEGNLSSAIEGNSAVFVIRVEAVREADPSNMTQSQRQEIREALREQKGAAFMDTWIEQLRKDADIEDNRSRVLRG